MPVKSLTVYSTSQRKGGCAYVGSKRISDDVLRAIVSNAYRISDEAWMRIDATLDDLEKKEAMKHEK